MATGGILSQGGQPVSQAGQATGGVNSGGRVGGDGWWHLKRRHAALVLQAQVRQWYSAMAGASQGGTPLAGMPTLVAYQLADNPTRQGDPWVVYPLVYGTHGDDPALSLMARTPAARPATILFARRRRWQVPIGLVLLKTTQVPC